MNAATPTSAPPRTLPDAVWTEVACRLELDVTGPAQLALHVALAHGPQHDDERLELRLDGHALPPPRELPAPHAGRVHLLRVDGGRLVVEYSATARRAPAAGPAGPSPDEDDALAADLLTYTRPSRYAESDRLVALAAAEFGGLSSDREKAAAVTEFVRQRLAYVSGSSAGTDSAVDILLAGRGVCRDFAHVVTALLRALDIPARYTGVYAPGLTPMDFHAVAEAWVDDRWQLMDATGLAPRSSMARIATGRDATDTAFLTTAGAGVDLLGVEVLAVAGPDLPAEDPSAVVLLG